MDRLRAAAAGQPSTAVLVASSEHPEYAMPAAGWSAKSGDPLLWVGPTGIPPETEAALKTHKNAKIYVLGPESAVPATTLTALEKLGTVKRVAGDGRGLLGDHVRAVLGRAFGWAVVDPGHGLVFASTRRPQDAAAAAALSATGTYGPLLLVPDAGVLPKPLQDYLLDIQPGYDADPVRGVYNHGWIIGDESAISAAVQARIDTLLEIQPVETGAQ